MHKQAYICTGSTKHIVESKSAAIYWLFAFFVQQLGPARRLHTYLSYPERIPRLLLPDFSKACRAQNKSEYVLYSCWNVTSTDIEGASEQYIIVLCHLECLSGAIKQGVKSVNLSEI